jgi:hypothetical protein
VTADLLGTVIGGILLAGLGAIAWFFRQWANELGDKVDAGVDKIDKLDEKVDSLGNDVAQMKVVVGWPPQIRQIRRN